LWGLLVGVNNKNHFPEKSTKLFSGVIRVNESLSRSGDRYDCDRGHSVFLKQCITADYGNLVLGHVPMGTTEAWRCVQMTRRAGRPPPSSRTLVSKIHVIFEDEHILGTQPRNTRDF
jgi:hypothetical protein